MMMMEYQIYYKGVGMHNKTKMLMKMTFFLLVLLSPIEFVIGDNHPNAHVDNMIAQQANVLTQATAHITKTMNKTIATKTQATQAIDTTRKEFIQGKKTLAEFTELLHANNARIAVVENDLKKAVEKGMKRVRESEQHMERFFAETKEFEALGGVLSNVGMENVQDIKEIARRKTKGLIDQKEAMKRDYESAKKDAVTQQQQDELKKRYSVIIKQLDADIAEQHVITGEVISIKRKLFWDAVDRAKKVINGVIDSEQDSLDLDPQAEMDLTEKLEKSAYEAEEKTRLLAQKMATEQDLDALQMQQDEVKQLLDTKIAEQENRDKERRQAEQELKQLKMQQQELHKQAEAKALEKILLEKEERMRLLGRLKAAEKALAALQFERKDIERLKLIHQNRRSRLDREKETVCADVEKLKTEQELFQQEAEDKQQQHEQVQIEYTQVTQEHDAIEQELYALELRKKELRKQAQAKALVQLQLSMLQGTLKGDVQMLMGKQEKCKKQLGIKTEHCKQLCSEEELIQAQLHELNKKTTQVEAHTKAKMLEKTQLEHERRDIQLQ